MITLFEEEAAYLGLVVPHLVTIVLGSNHRTVIPSAVFLRRMLFLVADVISRTVLAPIELHVEILAALVGGPFFTYSIMIEQKGRLVIRTSLHVISRSK